MKSIKFVALIAIASLLLTACSPPETTVNEIPAGGKRFNGVDAEKINIISDSETGCKYIFVDDGNAQYRTTAMSPLMKSDGMADCGQPISQNEAKQ